MAKILVHKLAKELGIESKDLVAFFHKNGLEVKAQSGVEEEQAAKARAAFANTSSGAKKNSDAKVSADAKTSDAEAKGKTKKPSDKKTKEENSAAAADETKTGSKEADAASLTRPKKPAAGSASAAQAAPKKKKNISFVYHAQNSNAASRQRTGGDRRRRDGGRRRDEGGEYRPERTQRIIRPRPENERPIRPRGLRPSDRVHPSDRVSPSAEDGRPLNRPDSAAQSNTKASESTSAADQRQQQTEQEKKPIRRANIYDQQYAQRTGMNKSGGAAFRSSSSAGTRGGGRGPAGPGRGRGGNSSYAGGNRNNGGFRKSEGAGKVQHAAPAAAGRKDGRGGSGRNHRQDHDALGKKQERFVNLEKNTGHKKSKNSAKAPERDPNEILTITIPEHITIRELADKMKVKAADLIKKLFLAGKMVTLNSEVDFESAEEIALEFNCICEKEEKVDVIADLLKDEEDDPSTLVKRPPVVCVMGHVDHGKTSLLDAIRDTRVTDKEAGGITQKIGAYVVSINGQKITFLDTPGHEAFTAMRMRGANSTDIAILVVAADDGVMPQTIEAINHAKAAGIEIIVAINKIDKPNANVERVKQELSEQGLIPEDWGGSTVFCPVSAHTHEGIDNLLEMILLTAEVLELKANPKRNARGLVIEAELDKGRGTVATVLVQKGTLHVGDPVAAGSSVGKVRAMLDENGRHVKKAGPSTPVEILGLSEVPNAGEIFMAFDSEREAHNFADTFVSEGKNRLIEESRSKMSLDSLFAQIEAGKLKELDLIVKADVQGSVEALRQSLEKLSNDEVIVKIIHGGVGAINESDVILASASNAIIIGFNVRPDNAAKQTADSEGVDIRLYNVIYNAIEDVQAAMNGMLEPIYEEQVIGHAEVRQIFKSSEVGNIAGSYIEDGRFLRDCSVRIKRGDEQIFEGKLASLKRFKDDIKEVKAGFECGLVFEGWDQMQVEDQIEAYIMVEVPRT